jgi:hypothetical protein
MEDGRRLVEIGCYWFRYTRYRGTEECLFIAGPLNVANPPRFWRRHLHFAVHLAVHLAEPSLVSLWAMYLPTLRLES